MGIYVLHVLNLQIMYRLKVVCTPLWGILMIVWQPALASHSCLIEFNKHWLWIDCQCFSNTTIALFILHCTMNICSTFKCFIACALRHEKCKCLATCKISSQEFTTLMLLAKFYNNADPPNFCCLMLCSSGPWCVMSQLGHPDFDCCDACICQVWSRDAIRPSGILNSILSSHNH